MKGHLIQGSIDDRTFSGYLSPSKSGRGPGVIVIQEWWGLVGHIKDIADRLALEGFTALAPDFYHGRHTDEPDEAGSLMMALDIKNAASMVHWAVDYLLEHPAVGPKSVGSMGFCMGGQLSLFAACTDDRIKACVDFYGIHPKVQPDLDRLSGPVLGIFAEHDDYASAEAVSALDSELTRFGKPHEFHTYPGTHHAFFNNDRPEVYDAAAAEDAWQKVLQFFRAELR